MACDVNTIIAESCESQIACIQSPVTLLQIIAQLTCELQQGGGGGGNNISGSGSPVGSVTPDAANQFYRRTDINELWQSTGLTSADWIQWV